tara:strand:- start:7194 stop:7385 length:192 start_codon:yes stop_codon:yes gene_type:complete
MDLLTNPWIIIAIVLSVIVGNIMALKYTAKMKFDHKLKKPSLKDDQQPNEDTQPDSENDKEAK